MVPAAVVVTDADAPSLRRDHEPLGIRVERVCDQGLAETVAVEVRSVDEVDAQLERTAQQRGSGLGVGRPPITPGRRSAPNPIRFTVRSPTRTVPLRPPLPSRPVQVLELRPGLWRWTGLHPDWTPKEGGPNGWEQEVGSVYYEASDAVVLIDPLVPPEDSERFWEALDRDVQRAGRPVHILLTVFWHGRSARELAERYGAEIWAHEKVLEVDQREVEPTRTFAFGDTLPGGIEPRDAVRFDEAIQWIPEHGALVFGDVVLGSPLRLCPESWLGRARTPS